MKDCVTKQELGFHTADLWLFEETGSDSMTELTGLLSEFNVFHLRAVDLGLPSRVVIRHSSAGWYLDGITVKETSEKDTEFVFPCQRWLDSGTDDRWTERASTPQKSQQKQQTGDS
ncbi:lipoxygenase homology domain-containing protein 1 [Acipenser ruthenus]|uniref:lipoxygenase homology domain-containing protein 1 n=1 Tax=Acipenser ruthenus TaxID=7906 RepID=UPI0027410625|nr:lipoxygenase homology domain-containing protein 1 [Acipenser ruthenus]